MRRILATLSVYAMTAPMAFAQFPDTLPPTGGGGPNDGATPVPEISALEGTAALAALVAVMLLVWERKRRAA